MIDKNILRSDRAALEQALIEAGATIRGRAVSCPFHDDRHPSGSIYEREGVWRFKCLACGAGGDVFDIRGLANGTTPADELKKAGPKAQNRTPAKRDPLTFANLDAVRAYLVSKVGQIESEHPYTSADGDIVQIVFRCRIKDGKTFRPVHLSDAGYVLGAAPKPWPLYRLRELVNAETVIVCEGEKCADILSRYSFVSCTSAGGAKNSKSTNWTPLAGKAVILWPDFDTEGRLYMANVESILQEQNPEPRLSLIDPAQLDIAEHEDVVDFVKQLQVIGKTEAEITTAISAAISTAKTLSLADDVRQRFADIRAGRYAAVPWPWPNLHRLTLALLPGTVTLLAGSGGATKSFMALQAFAFWMLEGLRVALLQLEENRVYHLTRVLAQYANCSGLTDPDFVKNNADLAEQLATEHASFLDRFGRVLATMPEDSVTLDVVSTWIEEKAKAGCRVIGVDPLTIVCRKGEPWSADERFLRQIKRTATDYGCSLLLVTHPVKSVSFPDLGQLAGGAAYARFCQTAIWLEHHENKTSRVRTACGTTDYEHNRTLHLLKARNGKGTGYRLAFEFDSENLTLKEQGIITKK